MAHPAESALPFLSILVADDETSILGALSRFFRRAGHTVQTAETAQAALALTVDHQFDVVLADANMPGDGREILARLNDDPNFSGQLVLMSGGSPADFADDLGEGVRFLEKPFTFDVLGDLIREITT